MPSNRVHQLETYPASWLAVVREAMARPDSRVFLFVKAGLSQSGIDTQQRKLRAFVTAYKVWPGTEPLISRRLAEGWTIKTHSRAEAHGLTVFSLSAHPPRGHEIELVKKAIAGG